MQANRGRVNVESTGARILNYSLFAAGLLPFYLLPLWAGVFDEYYGFTARQIGTLLTADLAAGTVASLAARFWIHEARWPPITIVAVVVTGALNLACAATESYSLMLMLRLGAGFSAGTMMAFPYAWFGAAKHPDREFSIALAAQVAFGAAGIALVTAILATYEPPSVFVFTAGASMIPLLFVGSSPMGISHPDTEPSALALPSFGVMLALLAVTLFMTSLTAVWVFVERIGSVGGMNESLIGAILAGGLLFSFLGAITPAWLSHFLSRRILVSVGYTILFVSIAAFDIQKGALVFAVALVAYNFFYSFVMPLQAAWIASSDETGRNAVLVPVAQGVGAAFGPIIAGTVVGALDYSAVIYFSLLVLLASAVCVYLAGDQLADQGS